MPGNEWIWVILAVALIFGATRLPLLGRNLGQGIKEFRKGIGEAKGDKDANHGADGTEQGPDGRITDRRD